MDFHFAVFYSERPADHSLMVENQQHDISVNCQSLIWFFYVYKVNSLKTFKIIVLKITLGKMLKSDTSLNLSNVSAGVW